MDIRKRNGNVVNFDQERITRAVELAMDSTIAGIDSDIARAIAEKVLKRISSKKDQTVVSVEQIQDFVEEELMSSSRKDAAKAYILYRNMKDMERSRNKKQEGLLSEEFLSKYKHTPPTMTQLGMFVFYRTYSRYLPDRKRRESWFETVKRAVEYNCSLAPDTTKEEAEQLFDNIFYLKQFLSGRTFWTGGTKASVNYPMSNYNCSGVVVNDLEAFRDLFYLLLIGTGVGIRVLKEDVACLPSVRTDLMTIHKDYQPKDKKERKDHTSVVFRDNHTATIQIGDSKEGWVSSLEWYLTILSRHDYRDIKTIIFDYDDIRPKGEVLKTFGGRASGHIPIRDMFYKIQKVLDQKKSKEGKTSVLLKPIDCLDIANIIGENVVSGGARRTSEIVLIDYDDHECIEAKAHIYEQKDGKWILNKDLTHRQISNNTIFYRKKPSREALHEHLKKIRHTGEPGFLNEEAAKKRRPDFKTVNPCFTGDMRLLTSDGYRAFRDLDGQEVEIINGNGEKSMAKVWCSGSKETIDVVFSNGQVISCTPDHVFMLSDGKECRAKDLVGKSLKTIYKTFVEHEMMQCVLGEQDYGKKENLPETIGNWKLKEKLSCLRGLFSTRGYLILPTGEVSLGIVSQEVLEKAKKLLDDVGIVYTTEKTPYRTYIKISNRKDLLFFMHMIGTKDTGIIKKLSQALEMNQVTVVEIRKREGKDSVYDFSETKTHYGFVEGYLAHNCGEVLLDNMGVCNLTTLNAMAFVKNGILDKNAMIQAQKLSARAAFRMTMVDFELHKWDYIQKRDRLTGCSVTGFQDMVNSTSMSKEEQKQLLESLREAAKEELTSYASKLKLKEPILATTCKPEGCLAAEHSRVFNEGIYYIDEIMSFNADKDNKPGFRDYKGHALTVHDVSLKRYYVNTVKTLLKVVLKNGRELSLTPLHPLKVKDEWIEASHLEPKMCLDRKFKTYQKSRSTTLLASLSDGRYLTEKINGSLAYLLGLMWDSNLSVIGDILFFRCTHNAFFKIQKSVKNIFMYQITERDIAEKTNSHYRITMNLASFAFLLATNSLIKLEGNRIPLAIRSSSREDIVAFICGLIDSTEENDAYETENGQFASCIQEVGESVGVLFDKVFKNNKYHLNILAKHTDDETLELLQKYSTRIGEGNCIFRDIYGDPFEVVSVMEGATAPSYDIEVEKHHWYFQGAILSHNTLSQLPSVSSGVHYSHSPYFIRRVRITANDPLVKVAESLNWSVVPEVGQTEENCSIKVIEFPVKAPEGRTRKNVTAIEQLENYKMFMESYAEHNVSITVTVRDHEWDLVEEWLWENWDSVVAVSFLSESDNVYQLMPYEEITKEEYERRLGEMRPFSPQALEQAESFSESVLIDDECSTGSCPVR